MELAARQLLDYHSMNTNEEADSNREIPDLMETALIDADQESDDDSNFYDDNDD